MDSVSHQIFVYTLERHRKVHSATLQEGSFAEIVLLATAGTGAGHVGGCDDVEDGDVIAVETVVEAVRANVAAAAVEVIAIVIDQ